MEIREAILKAADSIEQNPGLFDFDSTYLPDGSCDTPACALGWIAYHVGPSAQVRNLSVYDCDSLSELMGTRKGVFGDTIFYGRMHDIYGGYGWRKNAKNCAKALRLYADKYHPASQIPDSIRRIFDVPEAA